MQSYLTGAGLALLQNAIATLPNPPTLSLTGTQIGSAAGFVPDDSMTQANGLLLVDKRNDLTSARMTKVAPHEAIYTTIIDRDVEFAQVGNALFFLNNTPFLWMIAPEPFGHLKTNPVTHFAGDKCYLSLVFRFPYLDKLIAFNPAQGLHAKIPVFNRLEALTVPQHTLANQFFLERNNGFYGNDAPVLGALIDGRWRSIPFMNPIGPGYTKIDGGKTKSGF